MKRALSILLAALLLLIAVPTVAEEGALKAGLYVSEAGTEYMYLNEEGVGVLNYVTDQYYANGVLWTETSLEIERTAVPYALAEGVLTFTYDNIDMALRYSGTWDAFALGDQEGMAFAGSYAAEDGKTLVLTADGLGVYTDAAGAKDVFWGTLLPYWQSAGNVTNATCFVLFDSYLSGLTFADGAVTVNTETEGEIVFLPVAADEPVDVPVDVPVDAPVDEPADEPVVEPAGMTLISPVFDLALTLPADGWTVEETEGGLVVTRESDLVQYTFMSVALDNEPNAATLDAYADEIWKDALMGAGVAYDPAVTVRGDHAVGAVAGRMAHTDWTNEDGTLLGDSVLWFANGRLYVALCASRESTRDEALAMLDAALLTFRTAEEASQARPILLPVVKDVFGIIRDLPPVAALVEQVYYGYRVISDGESYDIIPILSILGIDPTSFSLTLRSDGTGSLLIPEEGEAIPFTWAEEAFLIDGEAIPFTRENGHIVVTIEGQSLEFAPAEEMEALLAQASGAGEKTVSEPVTPTVEDLLGTWTFTKARVMGIDLPADLVGTELSMVFNDDGSVILLSDGSPMEYEWSIREDGLVALSVAGEEEVALTFDGTVLSVVAVTDSMEMIFEREN